jgi:hypothetical protein
MFSLLISLFLASPTAAKALRRAATSSTIFAPSTLSIPIPTAANPFTTTIPGCGQTIAPLVIIGFPTSTVTLNPGTITRFVPPQAEPTTTTIIDTVANETEVIIVTTLPGECGEYPVPEPPSPTGANPSPTPDVCPANGCSGQLVRGATLLIDAINKVSLQSQTLQSAAKRVGDPSTSAQESEVEFAQGIIADVARGLNNIALTLATSIPRFAFLPPLPPGCDTDTVVIAFVEFVRIHQALLNILIGRAGLLEGGPFKRDEEGTVSVMVYERGENAFIGRVIATGLRAIERVVDTLASKLIGLCPTRGECAKQEKAKLSASLKEAIISYDR